VPCHCSSSRAASSIPCIHAIANVIRSKVESMGQSCGGELEATLRLSTQNTCLWRDVVTRRRVVYSRPARHRAAVAVETGNVLAEPAATEMYETE
jgi:hypothetical protein